MDGYHQLNTTLIYKYVCNDEDVDGDEDVHTKVIRMYPEHEATMYDMINTYGFTFMKVMKPVYYCILIDSNFMKDYEEAKAESMRKINLN